MKKIIITFVIILPLIIFNKNIISQLIIFAIPKLTDRNISIETIDIDYLKKKIILNSIEVESTKKIYYKNIFEAEKIEIEYDFKSLFTDLVIIKHLIFYLVRLGPISINTTCTPSRTIISIMQDPIFNNRYVF